MTMAKDDSIVGGPSSPSPRSVLDGSDEWCSDVDDTPLGIGIGLRREREREREREDSVTSSSEEWTSASTEVTSNTAKAPPPPPPPPPPPIPLYGRQQRPSPEMEDIPALLHTMMTERGVRSAAATKRIYELCDVGHKQNRVPMVCSGLYDVLTPLAWCLTQDSGEPHRRNLACLSLSNLSIPTENKHVMALGPASMAVLGGLCHVLAEDTPESYLCCICLMNLSFLQASIATMLQHSPVPHGCPPLSPLDNPHSLLRILERLLNNANAPPAAVPQSSGVSGKPECVRWACGLIKNLAKSVENAALIGQTDIPRCVFGNVRNASSPPAQWTSNSLEEFSFLATLNLSQWPVSRQALYTIPDRFYSPPECERSPPLAVVYDIRLGAAEGVGESSEATTVNSPATGASEDGDKDPKSIDDTLRCVMEEDSSSIDTYRTGTSTKNSFFGSRRSEKDYSSGDSSGDKSVDDLEGDTRANTFNILPFRFPFNELPRNIMTQSILSYVDSVDWLNFRAVSRGCYQIVHGTLDVWQFSDVTSSAFNADTTANGSECEALWRLALARDYQFDGKAGDECLQSIRSPARREDISWKDDDDIPFLSTRNIFTASNAFISWKHWRKLDSRLHGIGMQFGYSSGFTLGFPRIRGIINAPFYLRAGYMWQKIERWCDDEVSCTYGREIKSSLVPGRPWYTANWACNANLLAYQAVCAFYAGQGDAVSHSPSGLFGGFHACGTTSNTGWVKPHPENPMGYIVIATSQMKDIAIHAPTGQVFSIFFEDGNLHQLVSTTCPGGIVRYTGMGRVEEHPANLADGRDSILVWFEEIADQLRINDQDYTTVLVDVDIHHSTDLIGGNGGGGGENKEEETMTSADAANLHDQKLTHLTLIKYVASISILIFSIVLVGALMFTRNTRVSREANPYVCVLVCVSTLRMFNV